MAKKTAPHARYSVVVARQFGDLLGRIPWSFNNLAEYFDQLTKLLRQLSADTPPVTPHTAGEFFESGGILALIWAKRPNRIVGIASLAPVRKLNRIVGRIEHVVVDKHHRGRGLSHGLMNALVVEARSAGMHSVELTSSPKRIQANNLYLKTGFSRRETNVYRLTLNGTGKH